MDYDSFHESNTKHLYAFELYKKTSILSILQHYSNDSSVLSPHKAIYSHVFKPHSITYVCQMWKPCDPRRKKYIFHLKQVYVGSNCYISVSCHNPPIMGYHIYGFPHFTPATPSPISCAHSTITVCTIYNEEAKWNVKIVLILSAIGVIYCNPYKW